VRETLEIIGFSFRGTNTFQLGLGIMLILLSQKDIGVSNLRWLLELARKGFPRKKYIKCPEFPDIASKAESI